MAQGLRWGRHRQIRHDPIDVVDQVDPGRHHAERQDVSSSRKGFERQILIPEAERNKRASEVQRILIGYLPPAYLSGGVEHEAQLDSACEVAVESLFSDGMDQQTGLDTGQLHAGQQLRLVNSLDLLDTFPLEDKGKVGSVK